MKLKYLDQWTAGRQRNAATYRRLFEERELSLKPAAIAGLGATETSGSSLSELSGAVLPFENSGGRHIYNQFVIRSGRRDELMKHLQDRKIGTEIYYPVPMHLQECFAYLKYDKGNLPVSEAAAEESLALPIYAELTRQQLDAVVAAVTEGVERCRKSSLPKHHEDRDRGRRPAAVC